MACRRCYIAEPTSEQREKIPECARSGSRRQSQRNPRVDGSEPHAGACLVENFRGGICHYKVARRFDSSPTIGSIGRAMDIGQNVFSQAKTSLIVGAPQLKRYTAFGNLFAAYQGVVYRIDRHPVMSRHPVTPMREADIRTHLARQTDKKIGLVDLTALRQMISMKLSTGIFPMKRNACCSTSPILNSNHSRRQNLAYSCRVRPLHCGVIWRRICVACGMGPRRFDPR